MPSLSAIIAALVAVLVAITGVQTWRIDRLHNDLRTAAASEAAAVQLARDTADARKKDAEQARQTYDDQQKLCTNVTRQAIGQGRIIERIVEAPGPSGGARGLVGADSLRNLLGDAPQAAPGSAAGVPR